MRNLKHRLKETALDAVILSIPFAVIFTVYFFRNTVVIRTLFEFLNLTVRTVSVLGWAFFWLAIIGSIVDAIFPGSMDWLIFWRRK